MINNNFEQEYVTAINKLDNIDILPFFKSNTNFEEVISQIEDAYGEVFDIISRSEFADYINERYKDKINVYEFCQYVFDIK